MVTKTAIPFDKLDEEDKELAKTAQEFSKRAYCPYSNFPVGASVLAENEEGERKIFGGCNIENASFGGTVCAERVAILTAVANGFRKVLKVGVYCVNNPGGSPCGFCRQVIREFGKDSQVLEVADKNLSIHYWTLDELLPCSFGPESLC